MSSSDVFDVLNIKQKSKSPDNEPSTPSTHNNVLLTATRTPKLQITGMQRELYNLLGENQPPIVVQSTSQFKEKRAISNTKSTPWVQSNFKPLQEKKLILKHWTRGPKEASTAEPEESKFAKFNTHLSIPSFTREEYASFMNLKDNNESADASSTWAFEEVIYLFDLCKLYDIRWFIINDRYLFVDSNGKRSDRSVEDLKEMFYKVSKNYFIFKTPKEPLIGTLNFDKEKELERKKYLKRLLSRSAAEIAEEEALIIESKKFEMAAKKTLSERESILRLLDSPISDQNVSEYLSSQGIAQLYNNLVNDKSKKRKYEGPLPENPWMKQQQQFAQQRQQLQQITENGKKVDNKDLPSKVGVEGNNTIGNSSPRKIKKQKQEIQTTIKRKADAAYAEHLLQNFNEEERKSLGVTAHGEKLAPGVYLRSTKIPTFKPALQNKVETILQEIGLPVRPAMPSFEVVQKYEVLIKKL
ncbi:Swc4p NDAI_0K02150 [Naumovozyma dairenensis CBS 421]|uniref:SWR1-complex protein 4 n=1 Tax=Naumovozyma dairenensis (strain ATCC 10597 / BCRC 20456 / CBS 421 / NBRC 0211 / NRRL Y-12639) TaxID=1071378 RepID=G0WHZ5_NAUDC|nr:hypothetical protein NDAI_0K02150 [Naumovozyma dairenensis CBS 421]CCD27406.1 hypothetical protein NDAI_0K02150 [Naumovozyma dairenensis CBS 421]